MKYRHVFFSIPVFLFMCQTGAALAENTQFHCDDDFFSFSLAQEQAGKSVEISTTQTKQLLHRISSGPTETYKGKDFNLSINDQTALLDYTRNGHTYHYKDCVKDSFKQ